MLLVKYCVGGWQPGQIQPDVQCLMREIPEQCWDQQSHCWHTAHWTASLRLEYALWQTGQGYVGEPGFCSISPAKKNRDWRSGEISYFHLHKMLVLWLRILCVVWVSAGAARWPRSLPEEESRDLTLAMLPTSTSFVVSVSARRAPTTSRHPQWLAQI